VTGALLRVQGEVVEAPLLHTSPELAFDEGLDEKSEEVDEEERLDPGFVLEEDGGDLEDGLELLESLLDGRLAAMSREGVGDGERAVVGEERVHAVALVVVGNDVLVDQPLEAPAAPVRRT
jgi:hypothetical protein